MSGQKGGLCVAQQAARQPLRRDLTLSRSRPTTLSTPGTSPILYTRSVQVRVRFRVVDGEARLPCHTTSSSIPDRKSTRLNSSHSSISYAVFCLKKKKPAAS